MDKLHNTFTDTPTDSKTFNPFTKKKSVSVGGVLSGSSLFAKEPGFHYTKG